MVYHTPKSYATLICYLTHKKMNVLSTSVAGLGMACSVESVQKIGTKTTVLSLIAEFCKEIF